MQTVSSHILVRATVQPSVFLPSITVPIHITDFSIKGRMLVGFRLVQRTPGVSGRTWLLVPFPAHPDRLLMVD